MKAVMPNYDCGGRQITYAENQPEYEPLPAFVSAEGVTYTRWTLSPDERRAILDGACIELMLWTFGQALQPVYLRVEGIEEPVEAASPA